MKNWFRMKWALWFGGWKVAFLTERDSGWIALCRFGIQSEVKRIGPYTLLRPTHSTKEEQ